MTSTTYNARTLIWEHEDDTICVGHVLTRTRYRHEFLKFIKLNLKL